MAEITHKELQAAREAAGLYQHQVAALMHVSDDTVSRWERGLQPPEPDQVDELEKLYKAPGLWHGWMRYHHKSYRDRYPESPDGALLAMTMLQAKYQLADVAAQQDQVIRDALDGSIDDKRGFDAYVKELKEAYAALGAVLAQAETER